jgi:hypothetical protein
MFCSDEGAYVRGALLADAMQSGIRPARVVYGTAYVHASRFLRRNDLAR